MLAVKNCDCGSLFFDASLINVGDWLATKRCIPVGMQEGDLAVAE